MNPFGTHVLGSLNIEALRASLDSVTQRHESLRTRILLVDGVPLQHVDIAGRCPLEEIEVTAGAFEEEIHRFARLFHEEHVDVSVGPLFAARLIRFSAHEHVLMLALDHMIADGFSEAIVSREIWTLYGEAIRGVRSSSLPPLPVQFADYAIWQRAMRNMWLAEHAGYWQRRFADKPPPIEIPAGDPSMNSADATAAVMQIRFGDALSAKLRAAARRERTLLSLAVLSIYMSVMSRWCERRDLILLMQSNGRNRPELLDMVGFIASGIYLRIDIVENDCFRDVLMRVRQEFHNACMHQPFDWVLDVTQPRTELIFNWLPSSPTRPAAGHPIPATDGVRLAAIQLRVAHPSKFLPLFFDTPDGIYVDVHYLPNVIGHGTAAWFGQSLREFAEAFVERPSVCIASLPVKM